VPVWTVSRRVASAVRCSGSSDRGVVRPSEWPGRTPLGESRLSGVCQDLHVLLGASDGRARAHTAYSDPWTAAGALLDCRDERSRLTH
jgi:hypothetical protein